MLLQLAGDGMAQVCAEQGCDFVLGAGDNIYDTGISNVRDPLIQRNFYDPFEAVKVPFYMVIGNHDDGGFGGDGGLKNRGDVQIQYSRSVPTRAWRNIIEPPSCRKFSTNLGSLP